MLALAGPYLSREMLSGEFAGTILWRVWQAWRLAKLTMRHGNGLNVGRPVSTLLMHRAILGICQACNTFPAQEASVLPHPQSAGLYCSPWALLTGHPHCVDPRRRLISRIPAPYLAPPHVRARPAAAGPAQVSRTTGRESRVARDQRWRPSPTLLSFASPRDGSDRCAPPLRSATDGRPAAEGRLTACTRGAEAVFGAGLRDAGAPPPVDAIKLVYQNRDGGSYQRQNPAGQPA